MKSIMQKETSPLSQEKPPLQSRFSQLQPWLVSWELYLIVIVASFLRFYRLSTTEFDADQANLMRLAYDAVHYGLIPVTSTGVSFGGAHQPAIIYILMLPAAITADPLAAVIMMACLGVVAVLVTYVFTRRYYGRLAGTFAALFYATFFSAVDYSRLIWNHTLLGLFAPLFIFMLFRGIVDRHKGWLFPALVLLGVMFQLHNSSGFLTVALLVTVILAPGTIRWRDFVFAGIVLSILYFPTLLWEIYSKFSDIAIIFRASNQPGQIDNQALFFYLHYFVGYSPDGVHSSVIALFAPLIDGVNTITPFLIAFAVFMVCCLVVWGRRRNDETYGQIHSLWGRMCSWWSNFRADTFRCGLLILLVWQAVPVIYLSRHSISLYVHYFIYLMPGQYILLALLLAGIARWFQQFKGWDQGIRLAACLLAILIIVAQSVSSLGNVVDRARGNTTDGHFMLGGNITYGYSNDLNDLQNAFAEAEQVAQQHHLKHLYVSNYNTYYFMLNVTYLAEHAPIATTVFTAGCLVLPNPADGPAVFMEGPYDGFTDTLLSHFASATLVGEPKRVGGDPFKLYIVDTHPARSAVQAIFPQDLQLLNTQLLNFQNAPWAVTRWNILRSAPAQYQTLYDYTMTNPAEGDISGNPYQAGQCFFTSMRAGDQLLVGLPLTSGGHTLTSLDIQVQSRTLAPRVFTLNLLKRLGIPIYFEGLPTIMEFPPSPAVPITVLHTSDGKDHVIIPLSTIGNRSP